MPLPVASDLRCTTPLALLSSLRGVLAGWCSHLPCCSHTCGSSGTTSSSFSTTSQPSCFQSMASGIKSGALHRCCYHPLAALLLPARLQLHPLCDITQLLASVGVAVCRGRSAQWDWVQVDAAAAAGSCLVSRSSAVLGAVTATRAGMPPAQFCHWLCGSTRSTR